MQSSCEPMQQGGSGAVASVTPANEFVDLSIILLYIAMESLTFEERLLLRVSESGL